jgi:hypothetical protein
MIELDHLAYLSERRYRRQLRAAIRRLARRGRLLELTVLHEHDGSCCRRESIDATVGHLVEQLRLDGVEAFTLTELLAEARTA